MRHEILLKLVEISQILVIALLRTIWWCFILKINPLQIQSSNTSSRHILALLLEPRPH